MFGRQVSHFAPTTLIVLQRKQTLRSRRTLALSAQPAKKSMPDHVVICGGGIIGVATAYYLTLQGIKPLLVEKCDIACAASGALQGKSDCLASLLLEDTWQITTTQQIDQRWSRKLKKLGTSRSKWRTCCVSALRNHQLHCTALHRQSWRFLSSGLD